MIEEKTPLSEEKLNLKTDPRFDVVHKMNRDIQMLGDPNKMARKRTVEKISKEIVNNNYTEDVMDALFNELSKPLLKLYADPIDRTRELSIDLITRMLSLISKPEEYIGYIISTMHQRLADDKILEPTEEIRYLLVDSLSKLIDICSKSIGVYIDEVIQILKTTIVDPFADVKKMSCVCTNKLAVCAPQRFYQQGESLIPSLLKSLSHQHYKVRITVVKTIGVTIIGTSGKAVDEVFTHLAQRTFDHSAPVRLAVVDVVGNWLIKLMDRYSFFHKLLPLLLSGLSDDMKEIRDKSRSHFIKAGELYETENEKDFKEKKEYDITKHFEDLITHERPNLGCRALVNRNFSKILPAITNDITDWTPATRIKCSGLLYHLVYYCEDYVTMHMEALSQCLYRAAQDEEKVVVKQVIETAELVGLFVEANVYCKMILPYIASVSSAPVALSSALSVLSAYIRGGSYRQLADQMENITETLASPDICCTLNESCQSSMLSCIQAIVNKNGINHADISCHLFTITLNLISLTKNEDFKKETTGIMDKLSVQINMKDRFDLFIKHGAPILIKLKESCDLWSSQSTGFITYTSLLAECGSSLSSLLDEGIPIFMICTQPSKDAVMRQQLFSLLTQLVIDNSNDDSIVTQLQSYAIKLIKECILQNIVWQAGRTAAALRSVVMALLWAVLQARAITDAHMKECFNDMYKHMTSCLDDYNETTRMMSIKVILKLLQVCHAAIEVDQLHVIYPELLKRMDDSVDENRIVTCYAFSAYFKALPANYDINFYQAHLEFIYKTLLIHLDDPRENIQDAVLETLKDGACIHSNLLKKLTNDARLKHRTKYYCDKLLKICEK